MTLILFKLISSLYYKIHFHVISCNSLKRFASKMLYVAGSWWNSHLRNQR